MSNINEGFSEWKYDRGGGRYKHRWKKPYAGFVPGSKGKNENSTFDYTKLRKIAEEEGCLQEFDKWEKTYGK